MSTISGRPGEKSAPRLPLPVWPLVALFGVSLVSNLLMLTGPLFMLQIYDRVLTSRSIPTLVAMTILVCGLYGFFALIEWVRSRMGVRLAGVIDERLSGDLFGTMIRLRVSGRGRSDPVRDFDTMRAFAGGQGPISFFDLPWIPVYLAIVFLFHPLLGWLATAGAAIIAVMLAIDEVVAQRPTREASAAATRRARQLEDARANSEVVIAMGMLGAVVERCKLISENFAQAQRRAADWTAFYSSVTKAFRFLLQSAVLAVGAYLTIAGEITAGLMIAASIVSARALAPIEQVVAHWRAFVGARQAWGRTKEALTEGQVVPRETSLPAPRRRLEVRNLAAGPGREARPLIGGITFALEAGEALGIIGPSGSGKTTLARALVSVWPNLAGDVRLDGSELEHYEPEVLGRAIGYLPQAVELFDGTVGENIARFQPDAASEAILEAARAAQVHELIASLPNGYDTEIGERGAMLSAGQRQRIGLARALFDEPFLLVLDEPNSNLDHEGEQALTTALQAAKTRGAIVVVIAHRPSAVAVADKLLFLQAGRQGAFGPKDEVLRAITQNSGVVVPAFGGGRGYG